MEASAGSALMATYTRPKPFNNQFLPTISTMTASYKSRAPPHTLTHSLSLPWKPGSYYKVAMDHPTLGKFVRTIPSTLDKIPPMRSSNRSALFTKYSPEDWHNATFANFKTSECWRNSAQEIRGDTIRLVHDRDRVTDDVQKESSKNIGERVSDIAYWKAELKYETNNMVAEINDLLAMKTKLERALKETEPPLQNAQECLYHREQRQGIDLVHDEAETGLLREVDIIQSCQQRMNKALERAARQLSYNRSAQHELERDNNDKFLAQRIDGKCFRLKNTSDGIAYHRGVENVDATVSTPETWVRFTDDNLVRSQSERANSAKLRDEIDNLMVALSNEMWTAFNETNVAFANRIAVTTDAKNKLQLHLAKTLKEIFKTEQTINKIKKSITEKEAYMKVAQTRLDDRTRRPNVELCRDPPQLSSAANKLLKGNEISRIERGQNRMKSRERRRLVQEVRTIDETLRMLKTRLREEEDTLQGLVHTRATLEYDLNIKANTLFVDQDKCMGMRKSYPTTLRLIGYI